MPTPRAITAALALPLAALLAGCGGTPDELLSVSGQRAKDTIRPAVVGALPAVNAVNVSTKTLVIVTFSEAIDTDAVSGASISLSTATPGTVEVAGASLTFIPATRLPAGTTITVTVSGIRDRSGNAMAFPYTWSFTTAPAA